MIVILVNPRGDPGYYRHACLLVCLLANHLGQVIVSLKGVFLASGSLHGFLLELKVPITLKLSMLMIKLAWSQSHVD